MADGKQLEILIDGEVFRVNLELAVDAASGAAVGIAIRVAYRRERDGALVGRTRLRRRALRVAKRRA